MSWWDDNEFDLIETPDLTVEYTPTEPMTLWTPNGEVVFWPPFGFARHLTEETE